MHRMTPGVKRCCQGLAEKGPGVRSERQNSLDPKMVRHKGQLQTGLSALRGAGFCFFAGKNSGRDLGIAWEQGPRT
jgi:hypothetical protein